MRIGLTGHRGYVGSYMLRRGALPLECDVTNPLEIEKAIKYAKPDIVLHLAAKSDVDWCQSVEHQEQIIQTNVRGTSNVALACEQYGCQMVLLSSDHVFSGKRWLGKYGEGDKPNPVNYYGLTKLGAEGVCKLYNNTKIIRTSYLFDKQRLGESHGEYPIFLKRSFMHIQHFLYNLNRYLIMIDSMPKVLHLAGVDSVSWYELARRAFPGNKIYPRRKDLNTEFAPRGHNLGLNVSQSFKLGFSMFSYKEGLEYMRRFE